MSDNEPKTARSDPRGRAWIDAAVCGFVALLWLAAGTLKLVDPAAFARDIDTYRLVPSFTAAGLAVYLPWLEITIATGLCLPRLREASRLLSVVLLAIFSAALLSALARNLDVRCGCFGIENGRSAAALWGALARDVAMIAGLMLTRPKSTRPSLAGGRQSSASPG